VTAPVFLLGMMGAGKSTVGRELARSLGARFIDLDTRIEMLFGRSITGLFAAGEERFRAWERAALRSLIDEPGFAGAAAVVATGAGIVCDLDNVEAMSRAGRLVYLEVDVETLHQRLCLPAQRDARPLLAAHPDLAARLAELLAAREPAYRRASLIVDGRGTPERVAARIREIW
jgi:shikimate kinase